jgi:MucR family transcriptional regulator, transcriptional regulator of exopolysaccharide biosynthesis
VATFDPAEVTADIVAAFVSSNSLPTGELPSLIESVYAAVKGFGGPGEVAPTVVDPPSPAVSIRKSITPDYLICLEDGKRFKSMRRHLALLGMTPEQYRAKWGLPVTYPMAAPNYAAKRSALAKSAGLGQWRGKPVAVKSTAAGKAKSELEQAVSRAKVKRKAERRRKTKD